jgi:hypothetical protein
MSIRFFIIYASLGTVLAMITAILSGPIWGLNLDYEKGEQIQLIQIAVPSFLSYLTSAVAYAAVGNGFPEPSGERGKILRAIATGGFLIFVVGFLVSTTIYYLSANDTLKHGKLHFDQYTNIVTLLLGVLGVTTSAVATFIFAAKKS